MAQLPQAVDAARRWGGLRLGRPAVVVRNVRVWLCRSPGRCAGTRTHALTEALCTSSPATRWMSVVHPSSSLEANAAQGAPSCRV